MRKIWIFGLAALLVSTTQLLQAQETPTENLASEPQTFGGVAVGTSQEVATVASKDSLSRTVTLKTSDGELKTVPCGPEIKNFDELRDGATVTVDLTKKVEMTVIQNLPTPMEPSRDYDFQNEGHEKHSGQTMTGTLHVMAVVEDINYETREVTLRGPQKTLTVEVGPEAKNFSQVKKGDNVSIQITEERRISLTNN